MFTIPSALATHMAQDVATLAYAVKITPVGLSALCFTTAPIDCTVNGSLFAASNSVTVSSIASQLGMTAGRVDVSGSFDAAGITEAACHAGVYDFAEVEVYCFNWQDVTMGYWTPLKGHVSDVAIDGRQWVFECADLLDMFTQSVVEITSATCRAELFDSRCKVPSEPATWQASTIHQPVSSTDASIGAWIKPTVPNRRWFKCGDGGTTGLTEPTWDTAISAHTADNTIAFWTTLYALIQDATVTAKSSNQVFADSAITEPDDFWAYGKVLWLTGANAGASVEIKSQTGTVLELFVPMRYDVQIGDTFRLFAGCDKKKATCRDKFNNIANMRAEPDKPSSKLLVQFGER